MGLEALILDSHTRIGDIASAFDDMPPQARLDLSRSLGRRAQRMLYEKAAEAETIGLEHFVSRDVGLLEPVIHSGRNTVPLPGDIRLFEKRFARPDAHRAELVGYNESPVGPYIGPGYFVAVPTSGTPHWEARGGVVIDYFRVPEGDVPAGWPRIVDNRTGLQKFVYGGTRDFMRRVSTHVSIGAAFKGDKPMDMYFVLVRQS